MTKKRTGLGSGSTSRAGAIAHMNDVLPIIEEMCSSGHTFESACAHAGFHHNTVKAWVRQGYPGVHRIAEARAHAVNAMREKMMSDADAILALMETGMSARAACRALKISQYTWHNIAHSKSAPDIAQYMRVSVANVRAGLRSNGKAQSMKGGRPAGGYVYFIQGTSGGCIKIGYTGGDPVARLKDLQTGAPVQLRLLHAVKGSRHDEVWAHRHFHDAHSHGEWFYPTRRIMEFIASGVTVHAMRQMQNDQHEMTA